MTVMIKLQGTKELRAALANMSDDMVVHVGDEIADIAAELEADIKLSLQQGARTGRVYQRGGVTHQASAPGEAPANDTGGLFKSIYHERLSSLTQVVGSRLVYALHLEYGTRRMAPRPFFRPAVERMRQVFDGRIRAAIARATR